jgi:hypothetical protein
MARFGHRFDTPRPFVVRQRLLLTKGHRTARPYHQGAGARSEPKSAHSERKQRDQGGQPKRKDRDQSDHR